MSQPGDDSGTHSSRHPLRRRASEGEIHVHAEDIVRNVKDEAAGGSSSQGERERFWPRGLDTLLTADVTAISGRQGI